MSSAGSTDNKKKFIYIGVIGVCLVGAVLGYFMQMPKDESKTPAVQQATTKTEEIQKAMQAEAKKTAPKTAPPQDFERKVTRGAVTPPK